MQFVFVGEMSSGTLLFNKSPMRPARFQGIWVKLMFWYNEKPVSGKYELIADFVLHGIIILLGDLGRR